MIMVFMENAFATLLFMASIVISGFGDFFHWSSFQTNPPSIILSQKTIQPSPDASTRTVIANTADGNSARFYWTSLAEKGTSTPYSAYHGQLYFYDSVTATQIAFPPSLDLNSFLISVDENGEPTP